MEINPEELEIVQRQREHDSTLEPQYSDNNLESYNFKGPQRYYEQHEERGWFT